jgi:hypothetical protein
LGPHSLPAQVGVQQVPLCVQTLPEAQGQSCGQLAHVSPLVHTLLLHTATQAPFWQASPRSQVPQVLPQPSLPHIALPQLGVQHVPVDRQVAPDGHAQSAGQLEQVSPLWQAPLPHSTCSTQLPLLQE